jgi:hypothetical protein
MSEKHRDTEQFKGGYGDQAQVASITDTFGHGYTNTKTCVTAWTTTDGNSVEGDGMVVGERHRLVYKRAKPLSVVGTTEVFVMINACTILAHGHRTGIGTRLNMQNA